MLETHQRIDQAVAGLRQRRNRRGHRRRRPRERGRSVRRGLALHARKRWASSSATPPGSCARRCRPTTPSGCISIRWCRATTRRSRTAFTVSVDVRHGLTTGISAEERTNTVRALANGNSGASDFVRPGHVFPLVGARRRRADALGPYRGLHRSLQARRRAGGRRAVRTDERRRQRDARRAGRGLCRKARTEAALDRRPDRLPAGAREAGRAGRRISGRVHRSGRCAAMPM